MTAIQSKGALTTLPGGPTYFGMSVPGPVEGYTWGADYAHLYRTQANVRLVVDFLARNVGQVALHFFRRESDTDRTRLVGEQPATLLDRPNPATTPYRLMAALVSDLAIYGLAYWAKIGTKAAPGLARLRPWQVFPKGQDYGPPIGFEVTTAEGRVTVPPERIVYFRFYNPLSERMGLSPLESLRRMLVEEAAAADYRARYWNQGAKVSGFIQRPKDAPRWNTDARDRFMADWRARYTGEGMEVGGTPVLEDGMTYNPASFSARDSQYLEARKLAREEVAAAYFIPPPMVGILDNANYSNTKQFHQQLYQDTLGPWFELIAQEVELQLVPDFDTTGAVYAEFNIADKLKGSFEEQAAALSLAVGAPWMSRAEARGRQNLPELDDPTYGELITPLNVTVGGQAAPNAPQPDTAEPPPLNAASLQAALMDRATTRLTDALFSDGAMRRARRVLSEATDDLLDATA